MNQLIFDLLSAEVREVELASLTFNYIQHSKPQGDK